MYVIMIIHICDWCFSVHRGTSLKLVKMGGTHSNSCTLEDAFESEKDFQTANLLKNLSIHGTLLRKV